MTKQERYELIKITALTYLSCKQQDTIYMREPSRETLIATGKLLGMLTLLELDFEEDLKNYAITIKYRSGRKFGVFALKAGC